MQYEFNAEQKRGTNFTQYSAQLEAEEARRNAQQAPHANGAIDKAATNGQNGADPADTVNPAPRPIGRMTRPRRPSQVGRVVANPEVPLGEFIEDSVNPDPVGVNVSGGSSSNRLRKSSSRSLH